MAPALARPSLRTRLEGGVPPTTVPAWQVLAVLVAASRPPGPVKRQITVSALTTDMTTLSFDEQGVDVVYQGTEFRLEKDLVEEAVRKEYFDVTDHEVLKIIEEEPALRGEPRRIGDIVR